MDTVWLLNVITQGEDFKHQFKVNVTRSDSLAQEGGFQQFVRGNDPDWRQ